MSFKLQEILSHFGQYTARACGREPPHGKRQNFLLPNEPLASGFAPLREGRKIALI
jgi:hypothetical protein